MGLRKEAKKVKEAAVAPAIDVKEADEGADEVNDFTMVD